MNTELSQQNKAVIYCRVSTKEQVEEGNSLATQERNCREYAQKHNYEVGRVFIEEGESAKTADRTELQKLLKFCSDKKNQIKAVIIYKIDRLSRNTDDYSQLRILLKRYGVEIKSTSEYFENTPAGRFMENIIANVAQFDNDVRTERSVGGMKDAVREGRYVWQAPIGYSNQKVNGKATIVQNQKSTSVKDAFLLVADRKETIKTCIKLLKEKGLSINGKPFAKSAFYRMLRNELYAGWINKFGERHKGSFEPIVSEELFARVQHVINKKKTSACYQRENPDFPLRRFITQPCLNKLTGSWCKGRSKKYAYYRFPNTKMSWNRDVLENHFKDFMNKFAFDNFLLSKLKRELLNRFSHTSTNKNQDNEILILKKNQLKERQNTLLQKNLKGVISDGLLKEHIAKIDDEIWEIDRTLIKCDESTVDVKKVLGFVTDYLQNPAAMWEKMPFNIKLNLQWFQFPKGVIFDGKEFGTAKISSLFKLKQFFLTQQSLKVNYRGQENKHTKLTKNSPLQNKQPVVWNEVKAELQFLHSIIANEKEKINKTQLSQMDSSKMPVPK